MSNTKALIKYVRDRIKDGPNITFGKPTVYDLVEALEASEHRADKLKSDIDAGAKDYSTLMDRHDAQFVRAEKAESDKVALEEDLKATEENLKEASGFIEELLSGLKHRFPVQYADLEGDEYGDDAFSSHDLFEFVIDPAVNAAQKAEAEVARLTKMVDWISMLFIKNGGMLKCTQKLASLCKRKDVHELSYRLCSDCVKEAARRAVAAGEEQCQK